MPMWETLPAEGPGLWKPSKRVITNRSLQTAADVKGVYSRRAAEQRFEALHQRSDPSTRPGCERRARLVSASCRVASSRERTLRRLPSQAAGGAPVCDSGARGTSCR
jgi:hypothetical protein